MRRNWVAGLKAILPVIFLCGLLALGLCIVTDFGLYTDEYTNHYFGVGWYNYAYNILVNHAPLGPLANATEHDVVHGPIIEVSLAFIEHIVLNLTDIRQITFFRHYATWVIFSLGVVCFYFLALRMFKSWTLGLLACLFLVIHPRIFSHAFYDSVDIPFLSFYIFSLYTLVLFIDRKTFGSLCLHAVVCAFLIDIRLIGGVIPAITVVLLLADFLEPNRTGSWCRRSVIKIGSYLTILALVTVMFWPYLWTNPFLRALDVVQQTPRVAWAGIVLYLGQLIIATELPWHYIPLWIVITTPLVYSVFFIIGLVENIFCFTRSPARFYRERINDLVIGAAFLFPLFAVIGLKAVVYDSWRHLFFVYPAFVLVSIGGLKSTFAAVDAWCEGTSKVFFKSIVIIGITINVMTVSWFMIKNHPYQNVYFNRLAGKDFKQIKGRFELDYWALSYREALEYVMKNDRNGAIKIYHGNNALLAINSFILDPVERARIQSVEFDRAEYVLTNFRQVRNGYPTLSEYYSVKVEGESILSVYRKIPKSTP